MDIITLLFTAVGLAMDAFSVSVSSGMILKNIRPYHAFKVGLFFGVFQFLMPCIGYFLGCGFSDVIESYASWIAFLILGFIGGKMIWEAINPKEESVADPMNNKILTILAIATSIDALAVGITFAAMGMNLFGGIGMATIPNSAIIGVVAFVFSCSGVYIGNKCGDVFGNKAEIAGGTVLIAIGIKILIQSFI